MDFFEVFCLFEVHVGNELASELPFERRLVGTFSACVFESTFSERPRPAKQITRDFYTPVNGQIKNT